MKLLAEVSFLSHKTESHKTEVVSRLSWFHSTHLKSEDSMVAYDAREWCSVPSTTKHQSRIRKKVLI